MADQLKKVHENYRLLSVLIVIVSFLVLSSCPLKKAIQVWLNGTLQTEHTLMGHGKSLISLVCASGENSFDNKISSSLRKPEANAPLFTAILLTAFWAIGFFSKSDSRILSFREPNPLPIHSVPIYLRNRTFLI